MSELHRIDWPHGDLSPITKRPMCPDGCVCERAAEWGRPCERDIPFNLNEPENAVAPGGDYMCERLPPPGGWNQ